MIQHVRLMYEGAQKQRHNFFNFKLQSSYLLFTPNSDNVTSKSKMFSKSCSNFFAGMRGKLLQTTSVWEQEYGKMAVWASRFPYFRSLASSMLHSLLESLYFINFFKNPGIDGGSIFW